MVRKRRAGRTSVTTQLNWRRGPSSRSTRLPWLGFHRQYHFQRRLALMQRKT